MSQKDYSYTSRHIADNPALYEVKRKNTFVFVVTGLSKLVRTGVDEATSESDYIKNVSDIIRISCNAVDVPSTQSSVISVKRMNGTVKYASTVDFQELSITFDDFIGAETLSALMAWDRLRYDVNKEAVGNASDYKHDAELIEYAPDGSTIIRYWTLKGAWINNLKADSDSYDSTDNAKISGTVVYDRAIMHMPD